MSYGILLYGIATYLYLKSFVWGIEHKETLFFAVFFHTNIDLSKMKISLLFNRWRSRVKDAWARQSHDFSLRVMQIHATRISHWVRCLMANRSLSLPMVERSTMWSVNQKGNDQSNTCKLSKPLIGGDISSTDEWLHTAARSRTEQSNVIPGSVTNVQPLLTSPSHGGRAIDSAKRAIDGENPAGRMKSSLFHDQLCVMQLLSKTLL